MEGSSKEETWSDLYFRVVTEDEIKVNNSRVRLNPENPFKGLLSEASKRDFGQEQWKWRREIWEIFIRYTQTTLSLFESIQIYTYISQVLHIQWGSRKIINNVILMQWILNSYLLSLKENVHNNTTFVLVLYTKAHCPYQISPSDKQNVQAYFFCVLKLAALIF